MADGCKLDGAVPLPFRDANSACSVFTSCSYTDTRSRNFSNSAAFSPSDDAPLAKATGINANTQSIHRTIAPITSQKRLIGTKIRRSCYASNSRWDAGRGAWDGKTASADIFQDFRAGQEGASFPHLDAGVEDAAVADMSTVSDDATQLLHPRVYQLPLHDRSDSDARRQFGKGTHLIADDDALP